MREQPEDSRNIPLAILCAVVSPIVWLVSLTLPKEDR
jgi:hypothetical protein